MRTYRALGAVLLPLSLFGCATSVSDYKPKEDVGKIVVCGDCLDGTVEVSLGNSDVMVSMSAGSSIKEIIIDVTVMVTGEWAHIGNIRFFPERLELPETEGDYRIKVMRHHVHQESNNTPVILSQSIKIKSESDMEQVEILLLPGAIRVGDKPSKGAQLSFVRSTTYRAAQDVVARSFIQALFPY